MSMHSCNCPYCGENHNFRTQSAGHVHCCRSCRREFRLPPVYGYGNLNEGRSLVTLLSCGGLLVAIVSCCGFSFVFSALNRPSQQLAQVSRSSTTEPAQVPTRQKGKDEKDQSEPAKEGTAKDPKRGEDERKAKIEADAKAKADAESRRKVEADRCEAEMVQYELAKQVYQAVIKINQGILLAEAAESDTRAGRQRQGEMLMVKARARYQEVIELYPDTDAADESRQLLDGKYIPLRPLPPAAILPKGVQANEDDLAEKLKPKPTGGVQSPLDSLPLGSIVIPPGIFPKSVYVRGYTRQDGTYVEPHYRTLPETNKRP